MREIQQIIIHCSDTYPEMDTRAADIRRWHKERGWSDIGYNMVLCRDGIVEPGRDLDEDGDVIEEVGAHALGHNKNSIGICMIGGKAHPGQQPCNFTAAQWQSLRTLVDNLLERFPGVEVLGHNDVSSKSCPTFDVKEWAKRQEAA